MRLSEMSPASGMAKFGAMTPYKKGDGVSERNVKARQGLHPEGFFVEHRDQTYFADGVHALAIRSFDMASQLRLLVSEALQRLTHTGSSAYRLSNDTSIVTSIPGYTPARNDYPATQDRETRYKLLSTLLRYPTDEKVDLIALRDEVLTPMGTQLAEQPNDPLAAAGSGVVRLVSQAIGKLEGDDQGGDGPPQLPAPVKK